MCIRDRTNTTPTYIPSTQATHPCQELPYRDEDPYSAYKVFQHLKQNHLSTHSTSTMYTLQASTCHIQSFTANFPPPPRGGAVQPRP
eukprot:5215170-Amphidinium_carterae.1